MAIQYHRKLLLSYWDQFIYHIVEGKGMGGAGTGGEGDGT